MANLKGCQKVIDANRELIRRFEKKIEATIARVWGDAPAPSTSFSTLAAESIPTPDAKGPAHQK